MTVYSCPVCGEGVQTDWQTCPSCGHLLSSPVGAVTVTVVETTNLGTILERPYNPPELFIFEEVELGNAGGYHDLHVAYHGPERDWSEPYKKSSDVRYRSRVVRVPYPPRSP